MGVQIIIDSSADYEKQEIEEKGLICVPLTVTFADVSYRDCYELNREEFYQKLLEKKEYPKTSQPAPEDFRSCFQQAKDKGDSVIAILLSSGLSGTCQSAHIAKQMTDYDEIYIIDSMTAVAAIRILVENALALRNQGATAKEIAGAIENMKHRVHLFAAIDTLEYLYKGGRVTRTQAGVGELARLKPLITLNEEGKVEVCSKCIGSKKAMIALGTILDQIQMDDIREMLFVYTHDRYNCERFRQFLMNKGYDVRDNKMYDIGPTIGAHTGSGAFGFVYVERED